MPDTILLSALNAKRADHECIALRLALANAEIKSSEQHTTFLCNMRDQHDGAHAVSEAFLTILNQVLGARAQPDNEGSKQYYKSTCAEHLISLSVSEKRMAQMQDVIGPRVSRWLEGDAGEDSFRKYSEDPFDRYSEGGQSNEGTEDGPLLSPSHPGSPMVSRE